MQNTHSFDLHVKMPIDDTRSMQDLSDQSPVGLHIPPGTHPQAGVDSINPQPKLWFMQGMREPMNTYDEVAPAVHMMIDPQAFALRRSAVTISTVGVIPRMPQMMTDLPRRVRLALSLHAPDAETEKDHCA